MVNPDQQAFPVHKGGFHPLIVFGVPGYVFVPNIVLFGVLCGMAHVYLIAFGIVGAVHLAFAAFTRRGPYFLRYAVRSCWRSIRYLNS